MQPKIRNAILCDFMRQENTGKHILIGVYNGDVVLDAMPASIPLTFWVDVVIPPLITELTFDIKVEWPGQPGKIEEKGAWKVGPHTSLALTIPVLLSIERNGQIKLSIRFTGGRWIDAILRNIGLRSSIPPST